MSRSVVPIGVVMVLSLWPVCAASAADRTPILYRTIQQDRTGWLTFLPDNRTLLTGGTDRMIRRWDARKGEPVDTLIVGAPDDPLKAYAGERGAQVFRHCVACHTLKPDEGPRAGPSLWHVFGRHIATLPGYNFSPALKKMDIVWSKDTVAKLFEIGPAHYTPGTKMPEQTIGSPEDRQALVDFLAKVTK